MDERRPNPQLTRVTAAIVRQGARVLIARRAGSHLDGYWEFPGGKIEPGETPEQCLVRELGEEFGVDAEIGRFVAANRFAYDEGEIELLAYEATLAGTDWVLDSHDEARWVEIGELSSYRLAPADVPIAALLVQDSPQGQPPAADKKRS